MITGAGGQASNFQRLHPALKLFDATTHTAATDKTGAGDQAGNKDTVADKPDNSDPDSSASYTSVGENFAGGAPPQEDLRNVLPQKTPSKRGGRRSDGRREAAADFPSYFVPDPNEQQKPGYNNVPLAPGSPLYEAVESVMKVKDPEQLNIGRDLRDPYTLVDGVQVASLPNRPEVESTDAAARFSRAFLFFLARSTGRCPRSSSARSTTSGRSKTAASTPPTR